MWINTPSWQETPYCVYCQLGLKLGFWKKINITNGGSLRHPGISFDNYWRLCTQIDEILVNAVVAPFNDKRACLLFHTLSLIEPGGLSSQIAKGTAILNITNLREWPTYYLSVLLFCFDGQEFGSPLLAPRSEPRTGFAGTGKGMRGQDCGFGYCIMEITCWPSHNRRAFTLLAIRAIQDNAVKR